MAEKLTELLRYGVYFEKTLIASGELWSAGFCSRRVAAMTRL